MDLSSSGNLGVLVVGGLWALYSIGDRLWQDKRDRTRQESHDSHTKVLLDSLNKSLSQATSLAQTEQEKTAVLQSEVNRYAQAVGSLQTELSHAQQECQRVQSEARALKEDMEDLLIEMRGKDQSIADLVRVNRSLLRDFTSNLPPNQ